MTSRIYFLGILMALSLCMSCDKDDDHQENGLEGQWNLARVTGGFIGVNHEFEAGLILWTFDESEMTVTVENNNTGDELFDLMDTGTYAYTIENIAGEELLQVTGEGVFGTLFVSETELRIDHQAADGFLIELTR